MLKRRNLPLNAMRAFEAVARHSTMRKAAAELGVTHGALSRQVKLLEEQLGIALFEREHNRLQLTVSGSRLFQDVRDAFDSITEATHYLDPDSMHGPLVVDTTPSMSVNWLVALSSQFSQRYPEIELRLRNIEPRQTTLESDCDVAICYGKPVEPDWPNQKLFTERFFPVASPKILTSAPARIKTQELLDLPLIHDRHNHWPRWLMQQGIKDHRARKNIYMHESFQALIAAREGAGVAMADYFESARDLASGALVRLFDASITSEESVYLVYIPDNRLSMRARLFIDFLKAWLSTHEETRSSSKD